MNIEVTLRNEAQRLFYYATKRNQCFSGGFNNGKSYAGCLKAITLLTTFPNYRAVLARQTFKDLKATTVETFFKILPKELIESYNSQDGILLLKNNSLVRFMHLDKVDESSLRGLEMNFVLVDQAEEIEEKVYDVLDARVGRWDGAIVPESLIQQFPNWPVSKVGKRIAPSYMALLCNPDTQFHFIYRKYHPDSLERRDNFFFVEGEWDKNLGSEETYHEALKRGDEWVNKYIRGQWGISDSQIHRVSSQSLLDYNEGLIDRIKRKGNLFRVLDHGDASPTCCLWFASLDGIYICYREYYVPKQVISIHRQNISDLSGDEVYSGNYADPQIFKKTSQKDGAFWTTSDEYLSKDSEAPALAWQPADNNEFATRNRINELLQPIAGIRHPINGETPAPRLYFIKRSTEFQNGCFHAVSELQSQRRKLLGYVDGKSIYSDDREESITDHAYDCIRYYTAMHGGSKGAPKKPVKPMTFEWYKFMKKRQESGIPVQLSN